MPQPPPLLGGGGGLVLGVCIPGPTLHRGVALGDAVRALGSLGAVDLGVTELGLLGYLDAPSPHAS
jgi:hypothetical protein